MIRAASAVAERYAEVLERCRGLRAYPPAGQPAISAADKLEAELRGMLDADGAAAAALALLAAGEVLTDPDLAGAEPANTLALCAQALTDRPPRRRTI
jgi:hypothetical protein